MRRGKAQELKQFYTFLILVVLLVGLVALQQEGFSKEGSVVNGEAKKRITLQSTPTRDSKQITTQTQGTAVFVPSHSIDSYVLRNEGARMLVAKAHFPITTAGGPHFTDVPASHPDYASIETIYQKGITVGCSVNPARYCPNNPLTRGQLAVFVVKAKGYSLTRSVHPSSDVRADNPFYPYIETAKAQGLMKDYPGGSFRWQGTMTMNEVQSVLDHAYPTAPNTAPALNGINVAAVVTSGQSIGVSSSATDGDGDMIQLMCGTAPGSSNLCIGNPVALNPSCSFGSAGLGTGQKAIYCFVKDARGASSASKSASFSIVGQPLQYDVIVAGAGEGGVAAAIQAARSGARVALVEETDWLGGMMTTAGVTSMDGNEGWLATGIYKEFIDNIRQYYSTRGKSIGTCYWSNSTICFEPSVGRTILQQMIDVTKKGHVLDVYLRNYPVRVLTEGNKVTGIVTQTGLAVKGAVVIDATEYGDVLALSPALFRAGNAVSTSPNQAACIQDPTYTAVVKKYAGGIPDELKMKNPPPGYFNDAVWCGVAVPPATIQIRDCFAQVVSASGFATWQAKYPVTWPVHNAYRGMPDSRNSGNYVGTEYQKITKTGINLANDVSFSVADLERGNRKDAQCRAKLRTLQFLYYVQNELGEPWSVAAEEGYDTDYNRVENNCANIPAAYDAIERNMPMIPYLRESRRLVGISTLTARDLVGHVVDNDPATNAPTSFASAIALGNYAVDLHGCHDPDTIDGGDTIAMLAQAPGPFQVPFESLIPVTTDGLLVGTGKLVSASRLAEGSIRHQPISMLIGQAAGAIAALAVKKNVQPRQVSTKEVQGVLLDSKELLIPYADVAPGIRYFKEINRAVLGDLLHGSSAPPYILDINAQVPRKEAAVSIAKALALPISPISSSSFEDVTGSDPEAAAIEAVYQAGISAGCQASPRRFCPNLALSKGQLAVLGTKSLMMADPHITLITPSQQTYSDVQPGSPFYQFIETLAAQGIDLSCEHGKFCPDLPAKRAELAPVLVQIVTTRGG